MGRPPHAQMVGGLEKADKKREWSASQYQRRTSAPAPREVTGKLRASGFVYILGF